MHATHTAGRAPAQDIYASGPTLVEADRCPVCDCPASDGPYCTDECRDLDECRVEIRSLEAELTAALVRDQHARALVTARRLGAYERHLYDLEAGADGIETTGDEYAERVIGRAS